MVAWRLLEDGSRTWSSVRGAAWRYDANGDISAVDSTGRAIDCSPATYRAAARQVLDKRQSELEGITSSPFYRRALWSINALECSHARLPCYGDCRKEGRVVPCSESGADAPRSVGLYQFIRSTAKSIGVDWNRLATDAELNHRAALKLAASCEGAHQADFITLAVYWNAGQVKPDPSSPWGVALWSRDTLTKYARAWNAIGEELRSRGSSSSGSSGTLSKMIGSALMTWLMKKVVLGA